MKNIICSAVLAIVVACLVGGCATQRIAEGDHLTESGSAEIFYQYHNADPDAGAERTPLVFVHGWACDHQHWAAQVEGMPHDRAMLVIDLPGYGQSTDGGAEHTMDLYSDAVAAAMDDAGIARAVLIGHSMGTPVIRQFYRHYPERTTGLVAVDGALRPFGTPEELAQFIAPLFTDQWREFAAQMFDGMSATMANDDDRELVREVMLSTTRNAMRGGFTAMNAADIWGDDLIGAPLLLVLADAPFWTVEYQEYVRSLSPGVRIEVMTGVSHFLMMDDPEGFNGIVEEWLEHEGL